MDIRSFNIVTDIDGDKLADDIVRELDNIYFDTSSEYKETFGEEPTKKYRVIINVKEI